MDDPPVRRLAVADAEDDRVADGARDLVHRTDEEPPRPGGVEEHGGTHLVAPAGGAQRRVERLLDPLRVPGGEGDDAEGLVGPGKRMVEGQLDDPGDLGVGRGRRRLLTGLDLGGPVDPFQGDRRRRGGAGEGHQRPGIRLAVGEADQPLVDGAVVPAERARGQDPRERVEDRCRRLALHGRLGVAAGALDDRRAETGRRSLSAVAEGHHLPAAGDGRDRLGGRHL